MDIPRDIRPELAERYRQLRLFDIAELQLVRGLAERPHELSDRHISALRQALNLARLWVVPTSKGEQIVGPKLGEFRDRVRPLAEKLANDGEVFPTVYGPDAEAFTNLVRAEKDALLSNHLGDVSRQELDDELMEKALVLAVGGGGGCGYVHLGAFSVLEDLGFLPKLIIGSSIGSILSLFRAKEERFRDSTVGTVTEGLTFTKIFRVLDGESRYAMPGTLRLYLRSTFSRFFEREDGEPMRLSDLPVPFEVVVTGVRGDAAKGVDEYEKIFRAQARRGPFGRLLHLKDLITQLAIFISRLVATPGALVPISLGGDERTREFDALDAVGFSAAVPAIIQYDILREDPRMHALVRETMNDHGVDYFADGGISSNVPARFAWERVQDGRVRTRNAFILGLDCFAPQLGRNLIYLPLQRIAAENVARDRAFAGEVFTYRKVLSPTALVPGPKAMAQATRNGRNEFSEQSVFLKTMLGRLTPL